MKNKLIYYSSIVLFLIALQLLILSAHAQVDMVQDNVPVSLSSGTTLFTNGNITFSGTSAVENNGTIQLSGNWNNNSTGNVFTAAGGTVIMQGGAQVIAGTKPTFFNTLQVNSTSVTLDQDITTGLTNGFPSSGDLLLVNGNFFLNSHLLTVANNATTGITRTSGMIISETDGLAGYGRVQWNIGGFSNNYIIPFGNAVSNNLVPFSFSVTTGGVPSGTGLGSFTASTYPTTTLANPNNRPLPTGVTHLNNALNLDNFAQTLDRFWVLDVAGYATNPTATMTMTYRDSEHDASNGSTNTITESLLKAQRWDGVQWTAQTGTINAASNTMIISGTNIFNGSWALAGSNSPLPIELLAFDARLNHKKTVDLTWATAAEINNDYFTMERSADGTNFESIGTVDGAGNSNQPLHYRGEDENPFRGISYYRLKQTDFDGRFTYSDIKKVRIEEGSTAVVQVSVYPNPATDHAYIQIQGAGIQENSRMEVYNALGQVVSHDFLAGMGSGKAGVYELHTGNFNSGFYLVRILNGDDMLGSQKLIVK